MCQAQREVANILQKLIVEDNGWDGDEKARGGGDERFGDAGSDSAKAGGAGVSQAGKSVDDTPNRAEQADERGYGAGGGQPGHALFDAANFFRGSELHTDGDSLEAFQFSCGLRIAGAYLA